MEPYQFEFDEKRHGDSRYTRREYELVHQAFSLLKSKLEEWNEVAIRNGAITSPYSEDVKLLQAMIDWGSGQLEKKHATTIFSPGLSVGSLQWEKASLIHAAWVEEKRVDDRADRSWPSAVVESMRDRARQFYKLADDIKFPPASILNELRGEYRTLVKEIWDGPPQARRWSPASGEIRTAIVKEIQSKVDLAEDGSVIWKSTHSDSPYSTIEFAEEILLALFKGLERLTKR